MVHDDGFIFHARVEGLGKQLAGAFMVHAEEVAGMAERAIAKAVKETDIQKIFDEAAQRELRPAIERAMVSAIQHWLSWGGGKKAIDEAAHKAFQNWNVDR